MTACAANVDAPEAEEPAPVEQPAPVVEQPAPDASTAPTAPEADAAPEPAEADAGTTPPPAPPVVVEQPTADAGTDAASEPTPVVEADAGTTPPPAPPVVVVSPPPAPVQFCQLTDSVAIGCDTGSRSAFPSWILSWAADGSQHGCNDAPIVACVHGSTCSAYDIQAHKTRTGLCR
jgi:hypothetical protein